MHEFVSFEPQETPGGRLYDLLVTAVHPRPIAFVSTVDTHGRPNLAPFSFYMVGGVNPPSLMFSTTVSPQGRHKDTLRNAMDTGEFVVNSVHRAMAHGMNLASYGYEPGASEWPASGFTPLPSVSVTPARVAESLVQFECRLFQVVHHGEGPGAANYAIGEIVHIHVSDSVWDGSRIDPNRLRLLARLGGPRYLDCEALEYLELQRPAGPIEL